MPREWLAIDDGASKGKHAKQRVERSDFKEIRELPRREEGDGITVISYQIAGLWFGQSRFEGSTYHTLEIPGAGHIEVEGSPELPQQGLFVAIPENADVTEVKFSSEGTWTRKLLKPVRPVSRPVRGMERPQYVPDPMLYRTEQLYPPGDPSDGFPGRFVGIKRIAGRKVAHIMFYPVQYKPKLNLVAHKSIKITIMYRKKPGTDRVAPRRILQTAPADRLILDSATQLESERERLLREPPTRNCSNLSDCTNTGEYLIITTRNLYRKLPSLGDKTPLDDLLYNRGDNITVEVVTKEDILEQFREFQNESECYVILKFLRCARENWEKKPQWVILAGDTKDIPPYYQDPEQNKNGGQQLASDHFYADLWGDLAPDLAVSRLPTSDPETMAKICSNIKAHGKSDPSWANKILFMTCDWPADPKNPDRISCAQEVADKMDDLYEVIRMPCNNNPEGQVAGAIAAISDGGIGLVNYIGHGWWEGWYYGLNEDHLSQLTTRGRLPVVFSIACDTNCIDYDETPNDEIDTPCFGERWVREGKAVAFLGPSRSAYSYPDLAFQRFLFEAMMPIESEDPGKKEQPLTRVGDIMGYAKTKLLRESTWRDPYKRKWKPDEKDKGSKQVRDNIRMYLLLGDPCATIGGIGE